jgi:hypothetical protein
MSVNWGALGVVAIVSLAIGVLVVVLASLALVGLSTREPVDLDPVSADESAIIGRGGSKLSLTTGTVVATVCLLGAAAIVLYGLYVIVF